MYIDRSLKTKNKNDNNSDTNPLHGPNNGQKQ